MEDAHAAVLDLKPTAEGKEQKPTPPDKRLSYFGVYDGHGGEKVAQFAGESLHRIVAKQDAFKTGDIEQALKDGFLATDRAILNGELAVTALHFTSAKPYRSKVRRGSLWLHRVCRHHIKRQDLGSESFPLHTLNSQQTKVFRRTLVILDLFLESKDVRNPCLSTTSHRTKVCPFPHLLANHD